MQIAIKRGRDVILHGQPSKKIRGTHRVSAAALVGRDFPNVRPSFQVEVGSKVAIGQTLFVDSKRPQIAFCAPISGTVAQMRRAQRRRLDHIVISHGGEQFKDFRLPQLSDADGVRRLLLESGQWPAFRSRPFERIPDPTAQPAAIFVTAIDTEPLSAEPADLLREEPEAFRTGLEAIRNLTKGPLYVCQAPGAPVVGDIDRVKYVEFAGPHPAGLPGTHIHYLMPVGRTRQVWHIGYQDVIAIGRLFMTGRIWAERVVSLAGPAVSEPCLVRTCMGADLNDLVADRCIAGDVHIISGSVLSGRLARFLGRYHIQVSALMQNRDWRGQSFLVRLAKALDKDRTGAIIPIAAHENVMPFNIPPVPLLRALSVGDAETAERLGCLELAESDMALLTHVCPSKADYSLLLRKVLDEIEKWT